MTVTVERLTLPITGMTCASYAARVERTLNALWLRRFSVTRRS